MISIDEARSSDLPAVLRLLKDAALPEAGIDDHIETLLVARVDGKVVGSAALELYPDGALLRSVAVAEAFRGMHLGRRLTEAALTLAADRGITTVFLLTTTAAGFFPRFGFTETERDAVPAGVRNSLEFTSACPASARVFVRAIPSELQ